MCTRPLRVCLLTYRGNPRSGGQGIYTRLLARELVTMGHHVDVWSGQPDPELTEGVGLTRLPSLDLWNDEALLRMPRPGELRDPVNVSEWLRTLTGEFPEPRTFCTRVARRYRTLSNGGGYDIVHDNQSLGQGLLELQRRVPVVATIHHPVTADLRIALESAPNLYRRYGLRRWYSFLPMQKRVARRLDRILTVSQASASDISGQYGVPRDRMNVVGNGINLKVFRPIPGIEREPDHLVTIMSADSPVKGFAFLIRALAELRRERPALRLTVIGSLLRNSPHERTIRELGLGDAIHFTGRVEAEEIAEAYARAACAVVSSLYEGFGFPAGEAMACEVPVVSTTGGALPEVVGEDGEAGFLVEPGSGPSLADGIRRMLAVGPDDYRRMGKAGRKRVEDQFTWRRAAERTVAVYREAIAERAARGEQQC